MGIRSHVRIEYWQGDTKIPTSDTLLYPEGSDVLSVANIDAETEGLAQTSDIAWNLASLSASAGKENLLAAGFDAETLSRSIKDLKSELSDHTAVRCTHLNVTYPHPRFETIRLAFEAQSSEDFFGYTRTLHDVAHNPWVSAKNPEVRHHFGCGLHHRHATYLIHLADLSKRQEAKGQSLFSTPDTLRPFVFEFATRETDKKGVSRSVLHIVTLSLFKPRVAAPHASTEVVYWMRGAEEGFAQVVARRRLMDFSPKIWPQSGSHGEDFQFSDIPLVLENGNFVVEGKSYNLVSVNFSVVSRRKHDGRRPLIELAGDHVPFAGGTRLSPHVVQPVLAPAVDDRGNLYMAEGSGSATVILSPEASSPGTAVFTANQEPSEWGTRQNIRIFRGARVIAASAGSSLNSGRRNEPLCVKQEKKD